MYISYVSFIKNNYECFYSHFFLLTDVFFNKALVFYSRVIIFMRKSLKVNFIGVIRRLNCCEIMKKKSFYMKEIIGNSEIKTEYLINRTMGGD